MLATVTAVLCSTLLTPFALAGDTETWTFDETTTGQDVLFTAPTSVASDAITYETEYALTTLEVTVEFLGLPFGPFDVTGQIPPELQTGTGSFPGPAPITLLDETIAFPEPPEPASVSADVSLGLDASGFGFFNALNVVLGTVLVDLPIFGSVNAQVTSVRVAGQLTITASRWADLGAALAGTTGDPALTGAGTLMAGDPVSLTLENALPGSSTSLVVGFLNLSAPFKGGTLVPSPDLLVLGLPTGPVGTVVIASTWPVGVPPAFTIYFQHWITDAAGPKNLAASNAVSGTTP